LPKPAGCDRAPQKILAELPAILDRQQQVDEAGEAVAAFLCRGGSLESLLAALGSLLLREDRDFHTIQVIEAAFRQARLLADAADRADAASDPVGEVSTVMVAAARYLAAHAPTVRAQNQTFQIARRLHRGEDLFA
jgi:hypothetical protein